MYLYLKPKRLNLKYKKAKARALDLGQSGPDRKSGQGCHMDICMHEHMPW